MQTVPLDAESREWLAALRASGPIRDDAVARLHELLLRAARFEVARRRPQTDLDDVAHEAAADALVSVLRRLDDFRGLSRFTTWAYKFALLEAAVKLRRRAWQQRELPLAPDAWSLFASADPTPGGRVEQGELLTRAPRRDRARADDAPAHRPRRARGRRRPDRRPRGAPRDDARRALQDAARRTTEAAAAPRRRRPGGERVTDIDPELRAHLAGCPACREEHASLRALLAGGPDA